MSTRTDDEADISVWITPGMRNTATERELIHRRRTEEWYEADRLAKSGA
jgi:hypothetical protein